MTKSYAQSGILYLPEEPLDCGGQSHGCISSGLDGSGWGTNNVTNNAIFLGYAVTTTNVLLLE